MYGKSTGDRLVSAIIPTFNRSHLLRRAIDSILMQSYRNIEIIVVDDGSTDDTESVISEIARKAPNISYVKKINGGCASARNKGLDLSKGDYLAFLDSDDTWLPNAIDTLVTTLQKSNAELVYSPSIEVLPGGKEKISYPIAAERPEILARAHFMATFVRNGAYMFTRIGLGKVGRLDESLRYSEDSDFFQNLAILCKAVYSSIPTVRVYHHSFAKSRNRVEIYKSLLKSAHQTLNKHPKFAAELAGNADKRIDNIKRHLIEELSLRGDFEEARTISEEISGNLRLGTKTALLFSSRVIMRIDIFIQRCQRYLRKLYSRIISQESTLQYLE